MRKKTSTVIGLAIATILTASALSLSNQAFAITVIVSPTGNLGQTQSGQAETGWSFNTIHILGKALAGPEAQLGLNHILEGQRASVSHAGLGCPHNIPIGSTQISPLDPSGC
jgi:hypothetical protein